MPRSVSARVKTPASGRAVAVRLVTGCEFGADSVPFAPRLNLNSAGELAVENRKVLYIKGNGYRIGSLWRSPCG